MCRRHRGLRAGKAGEIAGAVVRATGLLDPGIRNCALFGTQVDDLLSEIAKRVALLTSGC